MRQIRHYSSQRRHGFTLIEIMIALSLFLVLLAVIFIPLNQAFQVFNAGRTSIALQGAADNTVKTIAAELRGAIAVYPNDELPGITDRDPYAVAGLSRPPYYEDTACTGTRRNNPARIDFLLPKRNINGGTVMSPLQPERYVITYFARRFDTTVGFESNSNPIGLFRAQMPYQKDDDTTEPQMNLAASRYGAGCNAGWLRQDNQAIGLPQYEPPKNIAEPIINASSFPQPTGSANYADDVDSTAGSLTLITPRDMGINLPSDDGKGGGVQPDLNFTCEDVDSNGVIDRVTITLTLVQYENGDGGRRKDGQLLGQRVTASQVVNLPNTRLGV